MSLYHVSTKAQNNDLLHASLVVESTEARVSYSLTSGLLNVYILCGGQYKLSDKIMQTQGWCWLLSLKSFIKERLICPKCKLEN